VEIAAISGLLSLGALAFLVFARFFPIVPLDVGHVEPPSAAERESGARRFVRAAFFLSTLAAGTVLAVVGFLLCARVGNDPWQDPPVPFSPLIFVAGMVLVFYSAAVYEILPFPRRSPRAG
jgi:hypothetical protein